MTDMDRILESINDELKNQQDMAEQAKNAQKEADKLKKEAKLNEESAKKRIADLKEAAKRAEEAKAAYNSVAASYGLSTDYEESETETEEETYSNDSKSTKSSLKSFTAGALAVALIATGAWALSKDSKTGKVRVATWFNGTKSVSDDQVSQEENYEYDYTGNVVTVSTPEPTVDPNATYAYDFEKTDNNKTIPVTAVGQTITNPIVNEELPANTEYVTLTTEAFESLTTSVIKELEAKGLMASHEDIVKYVMIRNIDKLRQDNNELITNIIGNQDITEVLMDGVSVIDAIRNYNLLYFDKYHTTDGFISATLGVFDEVQNARATEFERRVYELGANYQDEAKFNELTYTLLRDLYNPLNPISQLEDGVSYGVELIDMYMVRATFGTDRYIKLNDTNTDLVKYFVSFAGDGDEYEDNALMNGNLSNIYRSLEQCTNAKTLTK